MKLETQVLDFKAYFSLTCKHCIGIYLFFFVLKSEVPLVGNTAPDFEAEAVFDQEFIKVFIYYNYTMPFGKLCLEIILTKTVFSGQAI